MNVVHTLQLKQPPHWSAPVVGSSSLNESAKSNSYMGLAMLALSVSVRSMGSPVSGSTVRLLAVKVPGPGLPKKRLPVRELSVASMMAVKRWSTTGRCVKTSMSATMLGPRKHLSSTHFSCSFHPEGVRKSMTHRSRSMAAKRPGRAISVKNCAASSGASACVCVCVCVCVAGHGFKWLRGTMMTKSTPMPMTVVSMPDSAARARV